MKVLGKWLTIALLSVTIISCGSDKKEGGGETAPTTTKNENNTNINGISTPQNKAEFREFVRQDKFLKIADIQKQHNVNTAFYAQYFPGTDLSLKFIETYHWDCRTDEFWCDDTHTSSEGKDGSFNNEVYNTTSRSAHISKLLSLIDNADRIIVTDKVMSIYMDDYSTYAINLNAPLSSNPVVYNKRDGSKFRNKTLINIITKM